MRLLFIRHGDPDYKKDCLNEIGLKEAQALAALTPSMDLGTCYVSPLGRSQETAAIAIGRAVKGKHGIAAATECTDILTTLPWLREFPAQVDVNDVSLLQDAYYLKIMPDGSFGKRIVFLNVMRRMSVSCDCEGVAALEPTIPDIGIRVIASFDRLLADHGYVRDGRHYHVVRESKETLTFFCHFGITCVLLSHLWNVSPFVPLQSLCMPTSSVTELYTEERQKGYAHFRATRIGDTTHLTMAGLKPERLPHSALFAEVYSDFSQRHD